MAHAYTRVHAIAPATRPPVCLEDRHSSGIVARPMLRHATIFLIAGMCAACSFVKFERGPYAVRDVRIAYSSQEDVTFYSWRLRDDAALDSVRFELWDNENEAFVPIELSQAIFPAEPYPCGDGFLCFQYQVDGLAEPAEESPIRSVHDDFGAFAGPPPRFEFTSQTFTARPLAIDNNRSIDPRFDRWFEAADFPLKREFEWRWADPQDDQICPPATEFVENDSGDWQLASEPIEVDYSWTTEQSCMVLRPRRTGPTTPVVGRLRPSAETTVVQQPYVPPRIIAPSLYSVLIDLEIPNAERCAQVKDFLLGTIERAVAARGEHERLGVYTPIGDDGLPTAGCRQGPRDIYPIDQMLADATAAERQVAPNDARLLLIYINNVEVPPGDTIVNQFLELLSSLFEQTELARFTWAIGSNTVLDLVAWDYQTGWRPIEDETLREDIVSFTRAALPFSSMDHSPTKEIGITAPEDVEPEYFKLCQTSPFPWSSVGVTPGFPQFDRRTPAVEWPDNTTPFYTVSIEPQRLVAETEWVRRRVVATIEYCTAFCDGPFRSESGEDYPSWLSPGVADPMEVCKWTP